MKKRELKEQIDELKKRIADLEARPAPQFVPIIVREPLPGTGRRQ